MPCTLDFVNLLKSNLACDRAFYILSKIKRISFVYQCANEFYDVILFFSSFKVQMKCFFLFPNLKEQQKSGRSPFTVS